MDKADICSVALKRFSERGFHATTLRQIAADLSVTPAAIYYHYRSKDDLLLDLVQQAVVQDLGGLHKATAGLAGMSELIAAVEFHVVSHCLRREESYVVQHDVRHIPGHIRNAIDDLIAEYEQVFVSLVSDNIARGELPAQDVLLATKMIMSLGVYASQWFHEDGRLSAEEIARAMADYAYGALRYCGELSNPLGR